MNNDTAEQEQDQFVATIAKGRGEELRISLAPFKGEIYLAVRVWFQDRHGEMKPTTKGFNLRVELLPEVSLGIGRALDMARDRRLV
jgi:hypothetical protein